VADVPEYSQLSPRKESETSKILAGATFHGRIAMTGARYDRRISRGRSYIRRTYAERKFLEQALSYHARGLQGADRDHAQTLCEIEKPEKFFRSRVGLPVNGGGLPMPILDFSRVGRSSSRISHLARECQGKISRIVICGIPFSSGARARFSRSGILSYSATGNTKSAGVLSQTISIDRFTLLQGEFRIN